MILIKKIHPFFINISSFTIYCIKNKQPIFFKYIIYFLKTFNASFLVKWTKTLQQKIAQYFSLSSFSNILNLITFSPLDFIELIKSSATSLAVISYPNFSIYFAFVPSVEPISKIFEPLGNVARFVLINFSNCSRFCFAFFWI